MNQLTDMPDAVVAGRIAIGVWMLMFAAPGASLVRADSGGSR